MYIKFFLQSLNGELLWFLSVFFSSYPARQSAKNSISSVLFSWEKWTPDLRQ